MVLNGRWNCFFLNDKKLSLHMAQNSEHINPLNHKINYLYQISNIIVNLGINKGKNNDSSYCQLNCLYNSLLMSIVDTPENNLFHFDQKSDMRKVRTYSVKTSATLFSCSIRTMYNKTSHF